MLYLEIIVPCYNEEDVIFDTNKRLLKVVNNLIESEKITSKSKIIYVDDGSSDNTWRAICSLSVDYDVHVSGIKLSRNYGHQNAILAGLFLSSGDALITIDADLQDDVKSIELMVDEYNSGSEVVYGVRNNRDVDSKFKRMTAYFFYSIMIHLGVEIVKNHADYRLLSRYAVELLKNYPETNLFLRGVIPLIGLNSSIVYYSRKKRLQGQSKYPLKKMIMFAVNGITSFSIVPLRIFSILGLFIFTASLIMSVYVFYLWAFTNDALPGWSSIVLPMYLLGGLQILFLGVIGEYLGKMYIEIKKRPRYAIEKKLNL